MRSNSEKEFWNLVKDKNSVADVVANIGVPEWYSYFSDLFNMKVDKENHFEYSVDNCEDNDLLDSPITALEVDEAIKSLKPDKSPGKDGVNGIFIKSVRVFILPLLTKLFNQMFELSIFPKEWNETIIVPIHKKGNRNTPGNYRGISLLPILSKVFTYILHKRIMTWAENLEIIIEEQSGFRPKRSTIDNMFVLSTVINKYLKKKKGRLYCAYIDMEKAFDRINRDALWLKLGKLGISKKMLCMIKAIYKNVRACVKTSRGLTDMFNCPRGVKQGCILSPLLFSLFLNDIAKEMAAISNCITVHDYDFRLLLYADDMILVSDTPYHLQRMLNQLEQYCNTWNLNVNINKSKITIFRKGGYLKRNEHWTYKETPIEIVSSYKYLGIYVTSRCIWTECQKILDAQGTKVVYMLKSTLAQFNNLSSDLLFKIFDTKVLPILHYGAEIWGFHEAKNVERVHANYCKFVLGVFDKHVPNIAVTGELGRVSLITHRLVTIIKFWLKLTHMENKRLLKKAYILQYNWAERNETCWALKVKTLLLTYGFGEVWYARVLVIFQCSYPYFSNDVKIYTYKTGIQI